MTPKIEGKLSYLSGSMQWTNALKRFIKDTNLPINKIDKLLNIIEDYGIEKYAEGSNNCVYD